jgi:hypothetical protein
MITLSSILALLEARESLSAALAILLAFPSPILLFAPVGMVAEHQLGTLCAMIAHMPRSMRMAIGKD